MTVQAIESFVAPGRRIIRKGDVFADDDAVVVAARGKFRPIVERATARPGEQRARRTKTEG